MHRKALRSQDAPISTPTIEARQDTRRRRGEGLFVHVPLGELARAAPLGVHASFLFAVLYSLQQMSPGQFFSLRAEFEAAAGMDRRWWYRHSRELECAQLIEIQRQHGARARYRICPSSYLANA